MKDNFKQLALFNFEGINLFSFVQNEKLFYTHTHKVKFGIHQEFLPS